MMWFRNPLLLVVCLVLAGNLVLNRPKRSGMPHARREGFESRTTPAGPWAPADEDAATRGGDAAMGQVIYSSNCTSCHGSRGHGMPRQGPNLRTSRFVSEHSDSQLIAFLRRGRLAGDPASVMGLMMPARGGNRALDDAGMTDIVAFLRAAQEEEKQEQLTTAATASTDEAAVATTRPRLADMEH
jgi:mono/diheme cytochrome c family protein